MTSRRPSKARHVPETTAGRLPVYFRALTEMAERGGSTVSSDAVAEAAGANPPKVMKDLSNLAIAGTRGAGYDVAHLIFRMRSEPGLAQPWRVLIAGVGNLGHALANHKGFDERGFEVVALVDADPATVGQEVAGGLVEDIANLEAIAREKGVMAVLCSRRSPTGTDFLTRTGTGCHWSGAPQPM